MCPLHGLSHTRALACAIVVARASISRFVKNLNQSIKLPDLRALLYELFARYGDIHEIVCSGAVPWLLL